jgi:hypothetical protein
MENFREQQEKFDKLISELNSDLICGVTVGTKIQDSALYVTEESSKIPGTEKYKIGTFSGKNVIIDPYIKWADLRIFDENENELINLSNFGFDSMDMI